MEIFDSILNLFKTISIIVIIVFLLFAVFMYYNQDNLIYPTSLNGMKYPEDNPHPWNSPAQLGLNYKNITTKTSDNLKLAGWLVYKEENIPKRTMLYFHENAGSKIKKFYNIN